MNRSKVDILFFSRDALMQSEEDKKTIGQLYLEKRPNGKFLCFKKAETITAILLTKKMYKSLNRFTSGIRMERFYDVEGENIEEDIWDQDDDLCEDDVYYVKRDRGLCSGGRQYNLPAVTIPPIKTKEKAIFVVQLFKYVPKSNIEIPNEDVKLSEKK